MLTFGILDWVKIGAGVITGFVLACITVAPYQHWKGYQSGTADMKAAVERQNGQAAEAARRARDTLDDCYRRSGNWNQENGRCE